jgi:UDP-N-acetylmuramate dehydrogenase
MKILKNEPLKNHCYFKIGGPADTFIIVDSADELIQAVKKARQQNQKFLIIGHGSNLLFSDQGFQGTVIKNQSSNIKLDSSQVTADSGVVLNRLVKLSLDENLGGLEPFLGLPGTLGGAVYNNAHFQDKFIGNLISQIKILDRNNQIQVLSQVDCKFDYDYSRFQKTHEIILEVTLTLASQANPELAANAIKIRQQTQPLNLPSSGCIFKNPTNQSAGQLIDQAGLKGTKIGGAQISEKHANFIVNIHNATAQDVQQLIKLIQQKIKEKFNVPLELEIFIIKP